MLYVKQTADQWSDTCTRELQKLREFTRNSVNDT